MDGALYASERLTSERLYYARRRLLLMTSALPGGEDLDAHRVETVVMRCETCEAAVTGYAPLCVRRTC